MERIAVAGLSIHDVDVGELERVAARWAPADAHDEPLRELADMIAASEVVLLRTCNRLEIGFARECGWLPRASEREKVSEALGLAGPELRSALRFLRGRPAARHLMRLACSLESLVVGEDQILTQVRAAFLRSREIGLTGPLLEPVFEAALQVGKGVRSRTEINRHPVSVVALGVRALREELRSSSQPHRIALVGAGRTGRLAGQAMLDGGLRVALVVNRSPESARRLAADLGARPLALEEFRRCGEAVDVIVSTTSAPGFVLDEAALRGLARLRPGGRLIGIDLALPRDLEPVNDPAIRIVDLESLRELAVSNRERRAASASEAAAIVERKLDALARGASTKRAESFVGEILSEAGEVLEHELRGLGSGRLARLGETERREVERWARRTFGRLAHVPRASCKRLALDLLELLEDADSETIG